MRESPSDLVVDPAGNARFFGRILPCSIGRGGVRETKREGDGATPAGRFALERVYWRPDRLQAPRTVLPLRPIRSWDGWSDDVEDPVYNRHVRRPHLFGCERLRRADPLYDIFAVMSANRDPIEPGRGSALFVHVWRGPRKPTEGCVAFRRSDLMWILERWTPRGAIVVQF